MAVGGDGRLILGGLLDRLALRHARLPLPQPGDLLVRDAHAQGALRPIEDHQGVVGDVEGPRLDSCYRGEVEGPCDDRHV